MRAQAVFSMVVMHSNLSLSSANELQEALKYAFPDSVIAQEYKCKQVLIKQHWNSIMYMMMSSS